ncbi:ribosomal-protein-alanine N-acetyltransferase [Streptomyces sp. BK022]|uniref:GNAT family N-acetyltransferase n=1 Tax=Streptomyces sp. BK022 TaxID=2512123 RepID=UPI00102A8ADF|nr:GNAT family N-acetyltransferase [Streptomyces sp. BK022]RZU45942.1 ribosomal-protein-alanine N-acetyltransferase [Streptomyces sp. BK022]
MSAAERGGAAPSLKPLTAELAPAVMAFELANRDYFAAAVADRGDAYFARFTDRYTALLAEQAAGVCAFYLLVTGTGTVLGRFNLYDLVDGAAEVGYRVAEHASGRGVATAGVLQLRALASDRHGLHTLRAATAHENIASQRVLLKAGFVRTGPAGPADLGGRSGSWYQLDLSDRP